MNENPTIAPLLMVGIYEHEGKTYPCAKLLNHDKSIPFDAMLVVACLVSSYEAFINHVPEAQQNQFEEKFKQMFDVAFANRHNYMTTVNDAYL